MCRMKRGTRLQRCHIFEVSEGCSLKVKSVDRGCGHGSELPGENCYKKIPGNSRG